MVSLGDDRSNSPAGRFSRLYNTEGQQSAHTCGGRWLPLYPRRHPPLRQHRLELPSRLFCRHLSPVLYLALQRRLHCIECPAGITAGCQLLFRLEPVFSRTPSAGSLYNEGGSIHLLFVPRDLLLPDLLLPGHNQVPPPRQQAGQDCGKRIALPDRRARQLPRPTALQTRDKS